MGAKYRVGQEVEVSYRARVAEVVPGGAADGSGAPLLRLEAVQSGDYSTPPGGWLSPARVNVKVVQEALPATPGLYAKAVTSDPEDEWDPDGFEFYYLNNRGNWCDVGWGAPSLNDGGLLKRWREPLDTIPI